MSVDNYFNNLNPQNRVLLEEYKKSTQNQMWATTIILSLTIIDNILSDENNLDYIDGLDINHFKNSRDFHWLRLRRNQILHYEGPKEGFFESKDSVNVLKIDSLRADKILKKCFTNFFNIFNLNSNFFFDFSFETSFGALSSFNKTSYCAVKIYWKVFIMS